MNVRTFTPALAGAALLIVALTGCTTGDGDGSGSGAPAGLFAPEPMTLDEAQTVYLDDICPGTREYVGIVKEMVAAMFSADYDYSALATQADAAAKSMNDAADKLRNPESPWPDEVADQIPTVADQMEAGADHALKIGGATSRDDLMNLPTAAPAAEDLTVAKDLGLTPNDEQPLAICEGH